MIIIVYLKQNKAFIRKNRILEGIICKYIFALLIYVIIFLH